MHVATVLTYAVLLVGIALHLLGVAYKRNRTKYPYAPPFFRAFWIPMLIRSAVSVALFSVWFKPDILQGLTMIPGVEPVISFFKNVAPGYITAFFFGLLSDLALKQLTDRFPALEREIPEIPTNGNGTTNSDPGSSNDQTTK